MNSERVVFAPARPALLLRTLLGFVVVAIIGGVAFFAWRSHHLTALQLATMVGGVGFFSYLAIGYLRQFLDPAGLMMDGKGFSFGRIWWRRTFNWPDVSEFSVVEMRGLRMICFNDAKSQYNWWTNANRRALAVSDVILAHAFSAPIDEVCVTLNAFRAQALSAD